MKYRVEKNTGEPAYMQLYRQIREDITRGIYSYGDRLLSKRQLASETGTSVITVEHACALLADEGYIEPRERSGFYVIYREQDSFPVASGLTAERRNMRETPGSAGEDGGRPDVPKASAPESFFPFSTFSRTMRRVLSEKGEKILERSPNTGIPELRGAIASYLARSRGIEVSPQQIVIGSGAEYLYTLIVQMLGRDRVYALEDPSYIKIQKVYEANGAVCEHLKMGEDGILSGELARSRAGVLHVTPFNSYPSGITATASKRHEYIRWAKERRAFVVEDDFDSEFSMLTKAEDTLFSLEPDGTVIYVNTFSRTMAASMRVGYMVLPPVLLPVFERNTGFYSCTVPVYDQYVLAEFLSSGDFERHINRVRRARRRAEHR